MKPISAEERGDGDDHAVAERLRIGERRAPRRARRAVTRSLTNDEFAERNSRRRDRLATYGRRAATRRSTRSPKVILATSPRVDLLQEFGERQRLAGRRAA